MPSSHLCGVTRDGLVLVSPASASKLEFDLPYTQKMELLGLFRSGLDSATLQRFGFEQSDAEQVLQSLVDGGSITLGGDGLSQPDLPDGVIQLVQAIFSLEQANSIPRLICTAEELLVLPAGVDKALAKRSVRAFIANIEPEERLHAYGYCASSDEVTVVGDLPLPDSLEKALQRVESLSGSSIHVIQLASQNVSSVKPERVLQGWQDVSRLGIVRSAALDTDETSKALGMYICGSQYACPNLLYAGDHNPSCKGIAESPEKAELVARAEATERFISGEVSGREFRYSTADNLPGPSCLPGSLVSFSKRQYRTHEYLWPYDPEREYQWIEGRTLSGLARWVPAELTLFPYPGSSLAASNSSGIAAHTSHKEAADRALMELVERDAYMWTWLQQVSRERISESSLPSGFTRWLERLKEAGYAVDFVNLTLETLPVILCAVHTDRTLVLGNGCDFDPIRAAQKALHEAGSVLWGGGHFVPGEVVEKEDVHSAADHQKLYTDSPFTEGAAFLYSSSETVDLKSVRGNVDDFSQIAEVAEEPVMVDLTLPITDGLHVMRAFIPGFLPITFGYDEEPLGMPRASKPIHINGRTIGQDLDFSKSEPLVPHPFA